MKQKYENEFCKYFMANFPYSVHEGMTKRAQKVANQQQVIQRAASVDYVSMFVS